MSIEKDIALPRTKTRQLYNRVYYKINRKADLRGALVKIGVAALIILAAGYGWHLYSAKPLPKIPIKVAPIGYHLESRYNNTPHPERILLPDHSYVLLAPNSKIQYRTHFNKNERVVLLEGTAIFQVTKDATRPFTVKSYGISTTALGTRFKVVAPGSATKRSVTLYEGKVVVFAEDHKDNRFYLLPGNSLTYNKQTGNFQVDSFLIKPSMASTVLSTDVIPKMIHTELSTRTRSLKEDARFENVPLAEVLTYLSAKFQTEITYDKVAIDQINFVGTIHKNDSLYKILQDMALINQLRLQVRKTGAGYYLKK